ncbi:MAG TPA: hypothetical protein VGP47_00995 [Parachlamydiaceae bacterium]|nr:hypothetical protein [Parachlamydiaceae bacterium]
MNEISVELANSSFSAPAIPKVAFERVRQKPGVIVQAISSNRLVSLINENDAVKKAFKKAVLIPTFMSYAAILIPASFFIVASGVGLKILGTISPKFMDSQHSKIATIKNKTFGLLSDMCCLSDAVLITPFAFKQKVSVQQEKDTHPLLVCIHGFFHNKTCWIGLENKIIEDTKDSDQPITEKDIYALNIGEPLTFEEIDHYARFLATELEDIRKQRKLKELDVILNCHSMGGLVAAQFASTYATSVKVNFLLIANGTPWHGTPLAYFSQLATCGKQMTPDHSFQKELGEKIKTIRDRVYLIASKGDTVVPYRSALGAELDIPEDHRFTLDLPVGHLAMLYSKEWQELNIDLIKWAMANKVWEKN